jgi:hypothetical protein
MILDLRTMPVRALHRIKMEIISRQGHEIPRLRQLGYTCFIGRDGVERPLDDLRAEVSEQLERHVLLALSPRDAAIRFCTWLRVQVPKPERVKLWNPVKARELGFGYVWSVELEEGSYDWPRNLRGQNWLAQPIDHVLIFVRR